MRYAPRLAVGALSICVLVHASHSADSGSMLDEIVVSAPGPARALRQLPYGVTVITAEDIERSPAATVSDLLSREANLNLQSYFGGSRYSGVDMRGMGATATSNVLVLVDGVKLNENDLSAPDLSTIPLAQIERIEILRGAGGVRYGNGAVAGVINIITRGGRPNRANLDLFAKGAAYGTTELRAAGSYGLDTVTASINVSRLKTDGYRANGGEDARDGAFELQLFPTGPFRFLEVFLRAAKHHDDIGLPGPVSAAAMASGEAARRATAAPFDRSSVEDRRYTSGVRADFGRAGQAELQVSHRDRDNPYIIGYSPLRSIESQQSRIASDRRDIHARYDLPLSLFGLEHSISVGHERQSADYLRTEGGREVLDLATQRFGSVESRSSYAAATIQLPLALTINGGARTSRFETEARDLRYNRGDCQTVFDTVLVDILPGPGVLLRPVQVPRQINCVDRYRLQKTQGGQWRNDASEIGLTWQPTLQLTVFGGLAKHFRNPNVDELLLAASDLRPQSGETYQVGTRFTPGSGWEFSATAFRMTIQNEIYYGRDPRTGAQVNRNFDLPTERTGTELEARWRRSDRFALRANVGYVDARFDGADTFVPLVPRLSASAQVEWSPYPKVRGTLAMRFVGERIDGNDFTNVANQRLSAYTILDTAIRYELGVATVTAGINNLFDKVYSTLAYSETYYPMPGRNAYVSLRLRF